MKIEGPRKSGTSKTAKSKTGGKDSAGFDALVKQATESGDIKNAAAVKSVPAMPVAIDAFEEKTPEDQAREQAGVLLDHLDRLRMGIIADGVSEKSLHRIAATVAKQRSAALDPALKSILDEIELRARVELAKFEKR